VLAVETEPELFENTLAVIGSVLVVEPRPD
jgi:hypothetical protein